MAEFRYVDLEIANAIARITLNRPEAGNAMNLDLVTELAQAAQACSNDPSVKAVLLSARGKMFCAGGDLKAFSGFGDDAGERVDQLTDRLHAAVALFARMAPPLVIAVQGAAAGAGFSLSLAGDFVIAAESAKFTLAYTAAGLTPDGGATYYLPRLIGLRKAQELAFTNRVLSAQEAADWGLVTRVVAEDALDNEALTLCRRLADGPAGAQGLVKKLLRNSLEHGLDEHLSLEARGISHAITTADGKEGVRAFAEKRKPVFG